MVHPTTEQIKPKLGNRPYLFTIKCCSRPVQKFISATPSLWLSKSNLSPPLTSGLNYRSEFQVKGSYYTQTQSKHRPTPDQITTKRSIQLAFTIPIC